MAKTLPCEGGKAGSKPVAHPSFRNLLVASTLGERVRLLTETELGSNPRLPANLPLRLIGRTPDSESVNLGSMPKGASIAGSSNGRTTDFGSVYTGSSPVPASSLRGYNSMARNPAF